MATDLLSGWHVRVQLNGLFYAVKRFRIEYLRTPSETTNSESVPGNPTFTDADMYDLIGKTFASKVLNSHGVRVTLEEATFSLSLNLFTLPQPIFKNDYISVRIYPIGAGEDAALEDEDSHWIPSLAVTSVSHEGEVPSLQPVSLEGESDGPFHLFGQ